MRVLLSLRVFEIHSTLQAVNGCGVTRTNRLKISSTKVAFDTTIRTPGSRLVLARIVRIAGLVPHPVRKLFERGKNLAAASRVSDRFFKRVAHAA